MVRFLPLLLLLVSSAFAQAQLDFNMDALHPATASISYAGGATPLVGTDISVDTVTGLNTPLNNGVTLTCAGCLLAFTTGNLTGTNATNWFFGAGGAISIIGGIPALALPAGTNLLLGSFHNAQVTAAGATFKVTIATFVDQKDETLAGYYGLAGFPSWDGNLNLSFNAAGLPPNAFTSSSVLSGDVVNTPVPEPASVILLGTCLLGVTALIRKRVARSRS
jgi:hypothetical protein